MHTAAQRARAAAQIGSSFDVADLEAVGLALEGEALVLSGRVDDGMRCLDEAAAIVAGEDFELAISPAWAQCILISSCECVGDLGRVTQWCASMQSLGERLNGRHVIGVCRSAYGHVLAARGDWAGAEAELVAAVDDLEGTRPGLAPGGVARLAELRMRQGRAEEGRALFERALPHPRALTGRGTLALDACDARAAADAAERALRRIGTQRRLDRIPALELLARARARLGELDAARRSSGRAGRAGAHGLGAGDPIPRRAVVARGRGAGAGARRPRSCAPLPRGRRRPPHGLPRSVRSGAGSGRPRTRARAARPLARGGRGGRDGERRLRPAGRGARRGPRTRAARVGARRAHRARVRSSRAPKPTASRSRARCA
jgi:hypothetical protein